YRQLPEFSSNFKILMVRTRGDPSALGTPLQRIVRTMDPDLALGEVATMQDVVAAAAGGTTYAALLVGAFAVLGLVLAAIGAYGVVSYMVAQRSGEIGIRTALGAGPWNVVQMAVRNGCAPGVRGAGVWSIGHRSRHIDGVRVGFAARHRARQHDPRVARAAHRSRDRTARGLTRDQNLSPVCDVRPSSRDGDLTMAMFTRAEFRAAARGLIRTPAVALSAVACLGLGLGATASIASAIQRALLEPLPFRAPDRLVAVFGTNPQSGPDGTLPQSVPNYLDLARETRRLTALAAMTDNT